MTEARVIGIDVGGTKIAAGIVRFPSGERGPARVLPTEAERGGQAVLDAVLVLARELASASQKSAGNVSAIGLGICELVERTGQLASANCIDWLRLPVCKTLSVIAPTVLEADVRAAAVAESCLGAGRPFRNFLYVTVGTGISCCLVLNGEPYLGARGLTGTMASSPLAVPCERCDHTSRRTLEEIASGPALVARFKSAGGKAENGQEVLRAADMGDALARRVVESAGEALASQLGLLVGTLDPEAVVVGGGLGSSEGVYWDHFIASTRRHIWSGLQRELPILRAETGADAGWLGAAVCAAQKIVSKQLNRR
jgi:glucokinase